MDALPSLPLPSGVSETSLDCTSTCGLAFHILEAGHDNSNKNPLILLLHGFPELAYSWRKVMPGLAAQGYYVVAVDQRGYGRTTGWDVSEFSRVDLRQFTMTQLVRDMVALVNALGYTKVHCVVGHDFGAVSASMCALMRPDIFCSCIMMSHPFKGSPKLPYDIRRPSHAHTEDQTGLDIHAELARLSEPRKHYKWYNSSAAAATDWETPRQGLHEFLRGYIYLKSAACKSNRPMPLKSWTPSELAKLPYYYVMPLASSMPETVADCIAKEDPGDIESTKSWMPDADLAVYVQEWKRTGFQGGLNWYRSQTNSDISKDVQLFAGKKIEIPTLFLSGRQDWGNHQEPGALESYPATCTLFEGARLIDGAGHWPQQEQPERVVHEIVEFLRNK